DFLLYFEEKAKKHYDKWLIVYRHFERFVKGKCSFGDVTIELCNKFREYLLSAKQLRHPKLTITRNSAAGYWSTFRALLKEAYKERLLKENLNDFIEDIEYEEVKKNFLTADEVKLLAATPCEKPILKAASLFSILTGLRISDILKLRWEDIRPDADGEMAMFIRIQKTQKESIHPLSPEMLALCGERDKGIVFKGFNRSMTQKPLKKWLKAAGITKRITFHRFRDTFATLQLAAGTDIYTVSKMLDHANVTTTQIYARLVDSTKRDTVGRIKLT
ncbi:MAG: site-specific integrase, partial [Muribaculaceae bacterium]